MRRVLCIKARRGTGEQRKRDNILPNLCNLVHKEGGASAFYRTNPIYFQYGSNKAMANRMTATLTNASFNVLPWLNNFSSVPRRTFRKSMS